MTFIFRIVVLVSTLALASSESSLAQMITAHRGASFDAPENTIAAFELAWQQGADAIEGDFYLTADNQIVCIHDRDTLRTGGRKLIVEESILSEMQELEFGSWKNKEFNGEPIPTLAQVMATVPEGKRFVIELKSDSRMVPFLVEELSRLAPSSQSLLIISFDAASIAMCKQQLPDVEAHWLTGFKSLPDGAWTPNAQTIIATIRSTAADGVGMQGERQVLDAKFVETLTSAGCQKFHVWTIDSADDALFFQSLGACGITTNRPAFVRFSLSESSP